MRARRTIAPAVAALALTFVALLAVPPSLVAAGEAALVVAQGRHALVRAPGTYTVRAGDTLGSIANRQGTTVARLVGENGIADPDRIRVGQVLRVPGTGAPLPTAPVPGAPTTHVVRAGDTVGGIAARYGITQAQLVAANGLVDGRIYVGQRLRLHSGSSSTPAPAGRYAVRAGDTLSGIAARFGTTVAALQRANGLADANALRVGQALDVPAPGGGGGIIACPVTGDITFVNDWGFPRSGGRYHEGNDLFAPRGRPAVAVVAGVALQSSSRLGGLQVRLAGSDGVVYTYTHLDAHGASGPVAAGEVIGYVGSTGNAAGGPAHLHFEVHPGGGEAVNPYPRVLAAC